MERWAHAVLVCSIAYKLELRRRGPMSTSPSRCRAALGEDDVVQSRILAHPGETRMVFHSETKIEDALLWLMSEKLRNIEKTFLQLLLSF